MQALVLRERMIVIPLLCEGKESRRENLPDYDWPRGSGDGWDFYGLALERLPGGA